MLVVNSATGIFFKLYIMRFHSYFNTALTLIKCYDGKLPLAIFLKQYFALHKKYGSKDRKTIAHFCYCYFRVAPALTSINAEQKLKIGLFLCNPTVAAWQVLFEENWLKNWSPQITQRLQFIQQVVPDFAIKNIFPWQNILSHNIDAASFSMAHLHQPNLFIRIRPGFEKKVEQQLINHHLTYHKISANTLSFTNGTTLETVVNINKEVVVQDLSSQSIATFITPELIQLNWSSTWNVWDCCVASGGKTMLLHDLHPNNQLLLTDIRKTMFVQLQQRLQAANINNWKFQVADISNSYTTLKHNSLYHLIIADVPCTGSGTWARTPEQIQYFNPNTLQNFSQTQKNIVSNIIPYLQQNGYLLYITCSAFAQENENVVNYIQQKFHLQLIKMEVLKGYQSHADTMFAALLKKC